MSGASASESFVSCISRTSGAARSSHHSIFSSRAFMELTFQVAIRMSMVARSAARLAAAHARDRHRVELGVLAAVLLERELERVKGLRGSSPRRRS